MYDVSWVGGMKKKRCFLHGRQFSKRMASISSSDFSFHTDFYGCESALSLVSQADFTALHLFAQVCGSLAAILMRTSISSLLKQVNKWKKQVKPEYIRAWSFNIASKSKTAVKKDKKTTFLYRDNQSRSSTPPSDGLSAVSAVASLAAIIAHKGGDEEEETRKRRQRGGREGN